MGGFEAPSRVGHQRSGSVVDCELQNFGNLTELFAVKSTEDWDGMHYGAQQPKLLVVCVPVAERDAAQRRQWVALRTGM